MNSLNIFLCTAFFFLVNNICFSQEIMFRSKYSYNSSFTAELSEVDTTYLKQPELSSSSNSFNIDLSYLKKRNQLSFVYRIGYRKWNFDDQYILSSSDIYAKSVFKNDFEGLNFESGIYYSIPYFKERFQVRLFSTIGFEYSFPNQRTYSYEQFDEYDELTFWEKEIVTYPVEYYLTGNIGFGGYYYFFNKIGLGIEINNILYFNWANDEVDVEQTSQIQGEPAEINKYSINQSKKITGNNGSVILVLTYRLKNEK